MLSGARPGRAGAALGTGGAREFSRAGECSIVYYLFILVDCSIELHSVV